MVRVMERVAEEGWYRVAERVSERPIEGELARVMERVAEEGWYRVAERVSERPIEGRVGEAYEEGRQGSRSWRR